MEPGLVALLMILLLIIVALILFLPLSSSRSKSGRATDHRFGNTMFRADDRNWFGVFFYSNPDDPDLFVPKRYGLGWTINWAHPQSKLFLILFVLALLLPVLLSILGLIFPGFLPLNGYHPSGNHPIP